ncbi:Putative PX-associated domain, PX domain superfamily [Septoria linicola]|uniref:PX-associated domain, PX domain superfamily n=1 Tax=Septoria linicola TaxID=215465 RepID=A0A9Q9AG98_9PEZI|nr:putative PX-associated domain, PX domain superfamily [Septoria linicola]USW47019.1 Putative PX-associated domain, PX domain superfamily [Septoria linicola]
MTTQANGPALEVTAPSPPPPAPSKRTDTIESQFFVDAPETREEQAEQAQVLRERQQLRRNEPSIMTTTSNTSVPPPGSILTGKQEHYLKRELISYQTQWEISELSHPTALKRFGAPFHSDVGEVAPEDSELPLLRYIFVHHVRNFPFLDKAKEKEFWQDKLQSFLESFANKHISSADDRLEQTKRAKLALKATKLVELMMVSGIPTASGYEERIRFAEMEVVDRGANEQGLIVNMPEGHEINGWDVNVAGVRIVSVKRHVRQHKHAEFILRVKHKDEKERYVARRFGDFAKMHKQLRLELPGKVLPPLPRKNKAQSIYSGRDDGDSDSVSSFSTQDATAPVSQAPDTLAPEASGGIRGYLSSWTGAGSNRHSRNASRTSLSAPSPRASIDAPRGSATSTAKETTSDTVLHREDQRVSLRAFLRNFLSNEAISNSRAMYDFLTEEPLIPNQEELKDIQRRKNMDERRLEEQRQFFEVARDRARELDIHMEKFRRSVVEKNGLRDLFSEIKIKDKIADLDPEFKKFAEWLRIEVAATLYHMFLAEDNSPELFAQAKRIHSLVPYGALKQVIRFTNPAAVMVSVLDIFMAQPLGAKSLLQRIFGLAVGDGIRSLQRSIDTLTSKIDEPSLTEKIRNYTETYEEVKSNVRQEAREEQVDLLVKIFQSEEVEPALSSEQIGRIFNAYVAWNNAVENVDEEMRQGAELYARLKSLLKLYTRLRDKKMMLEMVEEPNTLRLFRDLFTIFYEPLIRVYKSANVYNSVTDFARFADDAIQTIEKAQRQDVSADPNQTVQSFIDLCERHEDDLYKFIHEVHLHDNGLFDKLMTWIEGILDFLRNGPKGGKLDMNALVAGALDMKQVDKDLALREINSLIKWQTARKRWHSDKTRQKMASGGGAQEDGMGGLASTFKPSDFGLDAQDLADMDLGDEDDDESDSDEEDEDDPIEAERKRRRRKQDVLKRTAGEPIKPEVSELHKMMPQFLSMLRMVLAE